MKQRYKLTPGLGITDTETDDLYITPLEIVNLLNRINNEIQECKKEQ